MSTAMIVLLSHKPPHPAKSDLDGLGRVQWWSKEEEGSSCCVAARIESPNSFNTLGRDAKLLATAKGWAVTVAPASMDMEPNLAPVCPVCMRRVEALVKWGKGRVCVECAKRPLPPSTDMYDVGEGPDRE